jgi:S-adenosylmethionine synthetase
VSRPQVVIESLADRPVPSRRVELVERKGIGHPDTMCDALVEAVAVALNRMYLDRLGAPAHYNIDKALLIAGECGKTFGGGTVTRPMELVIGDRATFTVNDRHLPVEDTVRTAVHAWLTERLPRVGPHLATRVALAPGSAELTEIFARTRHATVSNDTSAASGYAPVSPTETLVLAVEQFLNGPRFKTRFPDTGQDVKVFGRREDDRVDVTVAMPFFADAVASEAVYFRRKDEVLAALHEEFPNAPFATEWHLNNLDRPGHGDDGVYLTVTGTSAEDADSGQVGRGNRANGLIAFARPGGGEAAAGKNALTHAGKVYSVLAHHLAGVIHGKVSGLVEVYVHLAARIGEPVDEPWVAVQVVLERGVALAEVEPAITGLLGSELERLPDFRRRLGLGDFSLY